MIAWPHANARSDPILPRTALQQTRAYCYYWPFASGNKPKHTVTVRLVFITYTLILDIYSGDIARNKLKLGVNEYKHPQIQSRPTYPNWRSWGRLSGKALPFLHDASYSAFNNLCMEKILFIDKLWWCYQKVLLKILSIFCVNRTSPWLQNLQFYSRFNSI